MHRSFVRSWFTVGLTVAACARRSDPPSPVLSPSPVSRANTTAVVTRSVHVALPVVPPEPTDGQCTLAVAGGAVVPTLSARIDHLQIAVSHDVAKLTADVFVPTTHASRSWSIDIGHDGTVSEPVEIRSAAVNTRVVSAVAPFRDGVRPILFSARRSGVGTQHYEDAYRVEAQGAVPPLRSDQLLWDPAELTADGDGAQLLVVMAGNGLDCYAPICHFAGGRSTLPGTYDARGKYAVATVLLGTAPQHTSVLYEAACAEFSDDVGDGETTYMNAEYEDAPAPRIPRERCDRMHRDQPDAVAVAFHPTHSVVVFRARRAIQLAVLDTAGAPVGALRQIASGDVGAPAVAFRGDAAVIVWAQRERASLPYELHAIEWDPASGLPVPAATALDTGAGSAFAPAVSAEGNRTTLAWMEGNDRAGVVRVGSSHRGLAHAPDQAINVSAATANGRDPELAWNDRGGWLTWVEYPAARSFMTGGGQIHVSPLRCP